MKFLHSIALVSMAVAVSVHAAAEAQNVGSPVGSEAGIPSSELTQSSYLRRSLQANNTVTPVPSTTAPPPTTTAPAPTTPAPTTPAPTTPAPTTTAPAPTTPAPTTPAPTTTAPATTVPATTTPAPTTTTPPPTTAGSGTEVKTPAPTTAAPVTKKPTTGSGSSGVTPSNGGSVDGAGADKSAGSSDGATAASKDSKMGTGTIIGIVCGIVGGVAILAIIAVVLARRRHQEEDDDPLSPFELSMDKGYGGAPGFNNNGNANNGNGSQYGGNNGGAYSGARTTTNNSAAIGGDAVGGGAAVLASTTPSSGGADAAGVTYTQFYDVPTSPGSMYHQQQLTQRNLSAHTDEAAANNDSNLWMSAMEPKDNDIEGASVPPQVSLPGDEYDDDKHLSFLSRNSYDVAGSESIDIDQSSVLSGGSDLEKEFPDYENESSRGSYEL